MEAELKALKKQKKNLKRSLTKIVTFFESIADGGTNINDITVYDIKVRLDEVGKIRDEFSQTITQIESLDESNDYETEINEVEDKILRASALGQKLRDDKSVKIVEPILNQVRTDTPQATSAVRLPELALPVFNGDYESWFTFKDTFIALIHNHSGLTGTQKFYYLNSCLKGPASKLLSSLEISSNNYSVAWDLLKNRFENEKLIVNSHIDALIDLTGLTKENYGGLRNLIDEFAKHKAALEMLHQSAKDWDAILVRLLGRKLDMTTRKGWESAQHPTKLPTLSEMLDFLNNRCRVLETMYSKGVANEKTRTVVVSSTGPPKTCVMCEGEHLIYSCPAFTSLSVNDRKGKARELGLCLNCLRKNHIAKDCRGNKCSKCNQLHNRLLHMFDFTDRNNPKRVVGSVKEKTAVHSHCKVTSTQVMLSTALVMVETVKGTFIKMRALLDVGSDTNFVTKNAYKRLGLHNTKEVNIKIRGICMSTSNTNLQAKLKFKSLFGEFHSELEFLLVNVITSKIPLIRLDKESLNIPGHIKLADPNFHEPGHIDLLLGAEIFYELMKNGNIKLGNKKPSLRDTQLGWLVTGTMESEVKYEKRMCQLSVNQKDNKLHGQMERFWEMEEPQIIRYQSISEVACEKSFADNFKRDKDGKFRVDLPIKEGAELGHSKTVALKQFYSLEKRLNKNPEIKLQYQAFMSEYLELGHMELIGLAEDDEARDSKNLTYYIPHHPVIKNNSSTTKLRVVFNASAKTTNGQSLNDILHIGPYIQSELLDILLQFRIHKVVITGDIEKMYRQIWVDDKFTDLQRILWRENEEDPLLEYKLKTITYGTGPASFLATRVLKQLAIENKQKFPAAARSIEREFYMDDWLAGGESVEAVIKLKNEVVSILETAGLNLRKFNSNSKMLLNNCSKKSLDKHILRNTAEERTLGIQWDAETDILAYELRFEFPKECTKRTVLSVIAKIFDPLGLLAPITIKAKIFLQRLWLANLDWDDTITQKLALEWDNLRTDLLEIKDFIIPRGVVISNYKMVEIHGFSDASERAFGCAIYLKTSNPDGNVKVCLLCSKSKVAPVKNVTLPRLELCGAVLLVKVMRRVLNAIDLNVQVIHYWTDSSIVLNWIYSEPCNLKTFVANRISLIQSNTKEHQWHHVKGSENPADLVSRGTTVKHLVKSFWLNGPDWLKETRGEYEPFCKPTKHIIDKEVKICQINVINTIEFDILKRFSNIRKLVRVIAYCKRFAYNCRTQNKKIMMLDQTELRAAREDIIRLVQLQCFEPELNQLQKAKNIKSSSSLIRLNPCIDDKNIIRVGGRLANANIDFESKHPIILPRNHFVTELIIKQEHENLLHAGPQTTLSNLRQKYWPVGGRALVRKIIRKCLTCFRTKPIGCSPIMGNLPIDRVTPARPFSVVGVDYGGPFLIKNSHLRNRIFIKSYVCVFVCFITRAVHLDLVTSLDSEHFLCALKRFIARRGIPAKIVSDNGTNFVGAKNEISSVKQDLLRVNNDESFRSYLAENNVEWSMIPARSPHFGGLHEAAVKAAKSHLKKVASTANLTYESFVTVLCQIEGVLNSRPLIPITEDPDDLNALTPGHFLITQPLTTLPERNYEEIPTARLSVYQRQQQIVQHFWKKWQRDYLHLLQERSKWRSPEENISVGQLVLVMEDNLPPQQWRLARVLETHPGDDGVIRVVTLKTKTGQIQRAVRKVCPLPNQAEEIEGDPSMAGRMSGEAAAVRKCRATEREPTPRAVAQLCERSASH